MTKRFYLLFLFTVLSGALLAQTCYPVALSINSYMEIGGPAYANWTVYNEAEQPVDNGIAQFTMDDPNYEELLCLAPGCYGMLLNVPTIPANEEALQITLWLNGEPLLIENYSELMGMIAFTFCLPEFDCPTEIIADAIDCDSYIFYIPGAPGAEVTWTFGDGTGEIWGTEVDHSYPENGAYTVMAFVDGPACPGPFTLYTVVTVDCAQVFECPEVVEVANPECGVWALTLAGAWENEANVAWYVDDNVMASYVGQTFEYVNDAPGCHQITAQYAGQDCGDQVFLTTQVCNEGCNECIPVQVAITNTAFPDGPAFACLNVYEAETNAPVFNPGCGEFNNPVITYEACLPGGCYEVFIDLTTDELAQYIQVQVTSQGMVLDITDFQNESYPTFGFCTGVEEPYCPTEMDVVQYNCTSYGFEIGSYAPGESVVWNFGDGDNVNGGHFVQHTFPGPGTYTVNAYYSNTECPEPYLVSTTVVVECEGDCPTQINVQQQDCNSFVFWIPGVDQGGGNWNFGDGTSTSGGIEIAHTFEEDGIYVVQVFMESPNCPQGVNLYVTVVVDCSNTNECAIVLEAVDLGNGLWEITAIGGPEDLPMNWNFGDGTELSATWVVQHEFAPGEYTICATYETDVCPEPISACVTIVEEDEEECTEVNISMDSFMGAGGPSFLEWTLTGNGALVASGMAQYSENDPWYDQMLCLEDGCYVLRACGNAELTLENFELITNNGLEVVEVFYLNNDNCIGFEAVLSLNSECGDEEPFCEPSFEVVYTNTPGHVEFINTSDWNGEATFYWSYGDGQVSDGTGGNVYYNANGTYTVCLAITTSMGCTGVYCQEVVIEDMEEGCDANLVTISISGNYEGINVADLIDVVIEANDLEIGEFEIPLSAELDFTGTFCLVDGCYSVDLSSDLPLNAALLLITVTVNGEVVSSEELEQGMTVGGLTFGVNIECGDAVGEVENDQWSVYPNPANDRLTISGPANGAECWLFDASGRMVRYERLTDAQVQWSVANEATGLYLLRILHDGRSEQHVLSITR